MEGKRVSPSLLWPGIIAPICSQPSPALARAPWSDPGPAVCHETGAQVSNSGCCVGSVQADGVRCPQRLFPCGGPQIEGVLQNHRELVRIPPESEKNS